MYIANIYHRKDGRWEGRISRGKRSDGKRLFRYIFARTREDLVRKMEEIRRKERPKNICDKTLNEIFSEWYELIRQRVKESTCANYRMKAEKHILPYFGEKAVSAIAEEDIYAFISAKKSAGLSNRYISDILILIKNIFKYAVRTYHIFNLMDGVRLPKCTKPDVQLLDKTEQKKLQKYISENPNYGTLGTALAISTGIRIGELCALQWRDLDLEKRILTVRKTIQRIQCHSGNAKTKLVITDPKSESSQRKIPIPECMMKLLLKFRGKPDEYILTGTEKPIEPRTMQYRFRTILKNANLPSVHFHALRHIFASTCIQLGFDVKTVSELLGHSSVEITLNRYVHSSFEQKQEYMKKIFFQF